jgi:predicted acetyltransferase
MTPMTALVPPDVRLRSSWAEAIVEFGDDVMHASGLWDFDDGVDVTTEDGDAIVAHLLAYADPATEIPAGRVHCTYLWITDGEGDGEELVGYLAIRHTLTPGLLLDGGNIGFSVRPSRRREGHATRALALAVRRAADLGLDRVLLTCDEDNEGSRRTIEGCGGVYRDSVDGKRRYWIDTAKV